MKFRSHVAIAAHPDITLKVRAQPVEFMLGGEASLIARLEHIVARIEEVPLTMAVPFLPARRGRVVVGTLGPFAGRIAPVQAELRAFGVKLSGTLGTEGIAAETQVQGRCRAEVDVTGESPGKLLKAAFEGVFEE